MPYTERITIYTGSKRARRQRINWCEVCGGKIPQCELLQASHVKCPKLMPAVRRRVGRSQRVKGSRGRRSYRRVMNLHSSESMEHIYDTAYYGIEGLGDEAVWLHDFVPERARDTAVEDAMAAWGKELRKRPLLTKEQEVELAKRIDEMKQAIMELEQLRATGNLTPEREIELQLAILSGEEARVILIESNLRLVVSIARKYRGYGVPLSDLVQEGNIGLIQAVDRFDWRKGCRFSTCATLWIRQAIIRAIQAQAQPVKLPTRMSEQIHRLSRVKDILIQELGREPTVDELARRMRLPRETVEYLISYYPHQIISLDEPIDDDEKMTISDMIEDENATGPEEIAMKIHNRERIERALLDLPENQRLVIRLRYGLEDGFAHTYEDIGKRLNLSRQRVKQIADLALKRLKEHLFLSEGHLDRSP